MSEPASEPAAPSEPVSEQGFQGERPILVMAFDPLTETMPGPAIRAWHLAEVLAGSHAVVLAGTAGATRRHPAMPVVAADGEDLRRLAESASMIVAPTSAVFRYPYLIGLDVPLVLDIYIPTHLENLEPGGATEAEHCAAVRRQTEIINADLDRGDFFLCASERQRDFWLGSLAARGRINPLTYNEDAQLRRLIDVVAFGLPDQPPQRHGPGLRQVIPGIGADDPVVLWGGGVYNWFDPLSLVRAIDRLRATRPTIRLVFLGMRNPNPHIAEMRMASDLRALSDRLDLTSRHVFFNEGWVPYDDRANYLLDADVAVSTHLDHIETRFSFRTRVLDYLWAGLPMVLTGGDALTDLVVEAGLGLSVAPGDDAAIADAISELLGAPKARTSPHALVEMFRWSAVAAPLVAYARHPAKAADRVQVEPVADRQNSPRPTALGSLSSRARSIGARVRRRLVHR
ncbi:MAG: glycosyltransferase [Actinomycetota bacterium]|nr:glycosyltransferase [Actinomycetota bacterium]